MCGLLLKDLVGVSIIKGKKIRANEVSDTKEFVCLSISTQKIRANEVSVQKIRENKRTK